jgi:hypothetical protein
MGQPVCDQFVDLRKKSHTITLLKINDKILSCPNYILELTNAICSFLGRLTVKKVFEDSPTIDHKVMEKGKEFLG